MRVADRHEIDTTIGFRSLLLDATKEGADKRNFVSSDSRDAKKFWGSLEIVVGTVAVISTIATVRSNAFAFLAIASILGTLCAHELQVISNNAEELMDSPFLTRAHAAYSPENFTHACLKDTLVTERLFASSWRRQLHF